ncbi:MAG: FtsX-like permease family protein [Yaniella sp.]|uniref:ABC transporter permease n=1 Tax=Yaniella sp. TaxID=2773929 RepID=UPI002648F344|nr:FtsX-like permease family protein [Yaniella sp.]MDN5818320.1 FtsX-like permease family protein [Yaniella sp.]MDN5839015.1 FtsX-like permease family protein [Yaniella sp.]MDN5889492.1 FtsX-like permease family protein [Yaniella sp.]MDN5912571.1 FtsX-like permease family protein [Yaniella sp.]MDN6147745.1 FtsX-like permease family protein [Yaniella sp.]
MWKLALSELKLHPRRYVAVLLAILLGTMFLAGSLLVTSSAKESTKQMLGATYANADLLITAETPPDPESDFYDLAGTVEQSGSLTEINGVEEVYPLMNAATAMVLPEGSDKQGTFDPDSDFVYATNRPADASLLATPMTDGELPTADDEITVDTESAERHDLAVGDTVTLRTLADEAEQEVTVSGIMDQSMDPTVVGAMTIYTTVETLGELGGDSPTYDTALLRVDGDIDQVITDIQQALNATGVPATVNTPDVQISEQLVDMMGFDAITVVLGGFSAIALLVMMLVINNTFSVLVAQRTRQYALQRVLGATRGQIRKGVLAESVLIGLIGSITGIALAIGLIFGLLAVAQQWMSGATFGMDLSILWVLLAGVVITVVASWLPASQAMRVSPLEAMRPVPASTMGSKAGKLRLVLGSLMLLAGGAALVFFAAAGLVGMAIVAGAVSFIGVLALGVLFVPGAVYALGGLTRWTGIPGKMAQLNSVRNRSRTAATATALIVGTTLVAMILTGGRTAQDSTDEMLATNYPVDIYAELADIDPADTAQVNSTTEALAETAGIADAEALYPVGSIDESWSEQVMTADPEHLAGISDSVSDDDAQALEETGTVLVPEHHESNTLTVTTADGEVELDVVRSDLSSVTPIVSAETAEQLSMDVTGMAVVWLSVADEDISQADLQEIVTNMVADTEVSSQDVSSPLVLRSMYQQAIDAVMLTVIGLLGISVLIAFVGVANTLALSSLERTRENSLMRALGLTKRGLRSMLMWEAVLISAVGAILGSVLGMLYGWAGSVAIFSQISSGGVDITWPWLEVSGVIAVAVIAGLIASVAPSRRAAKMSPVEGLEAD